MPRVKGGTVARRRRKKILKLAKGYFGAKHLLFRTAKEQVMNSYMYAYRDRRQRKRDFRKLWIARINAAARMHDMSYSTFMYGLKCSEVEVNRKMLSEIAIHDAAAFEQLVKIAQEGIKKGNKPDVTGNKPASADTITVTANGAKPKKTTKKASTKTTETTTKKEKTPTSTEAKTEKQAPSSKTTADQADYSTMKVAELKEIAKEKNIKVPTGSKKSDIIELLK
jgi:large subunit ribosomal protein L20